MENSERLAGYVKQRTAPDRLAVLSEDNPLLTPAQRRRLRHKEESRKTHTHLGLPEYTVNRNETEYAKRVPCEKCCPQSRKKMVRIGGGPQFRIGGSS